MNLGGSCGRKIIDFGVWILGVLFVRRVILGKLFIFLNLYFFIVSIIRIKYMVIIDVL